MILIENKYINKKFFIIKSYEAGLVLKGWETKSIRLKNSIELKNSFIIYKNKEFYIKNIFLQNIFNKNDFKNQRNIKLLLNIKEILEILNKIKEKKCILLPINIFMKKNLIKIKLGLIIKKKYFLIKKQYE